MTAEADIDDIIKRKLWLWTLSGQTRFATFVQYLIAFCSRPEALSDVISSRFVRPIVLNKCLKFCDPCLNHFREIPPEAVGGGIFDSFFPIISDWKQTMTSYLMWL